MGSNAQPAGRTGLLSSQPSRARRRFVRGLGRLPRPLRAPLARTAWWLRQQQKTRGTDETPDNIARVSGAERWPIPPVDLRLMVIDSGQALHFLRRGRAHAGFIRSLVSQAGKRPGDLGAVLDFGCGCGRIARWLDDLGSEFHGCDPNPDLVAWCQSHLPFMQTKLSGLEPPLPYPPQTFGLIYALSIFTHIPADLQQPWIDELSGLLRPGGLLIITTSSDTRNFTRAEEARFAAGRPVARFEEGVGTNLCSVWHPRRFVENELLGELEVLAVSEPDLGANGPRPRLRQDAYLARKPASAPMLERP